MERAHWELFKFGFRVVEFTNTSYQMEVLFLFLLEIKAFENSAKQYQPLLPFFAVWDKKVCKLLQHKNGMILSIIFREISPELISGCEGVFSCCENVHFKSVIM